MERDVDIKRYLTETVETWAKLGHPAILERYALRNGKVFTPRKRIGRKGEPKNCFGNATEIVFDWEFRGRKGPKPTYVEGFCMSKELHWPFHHAWVTYTGDDAMDPTLDAAEHEYFGVTIETKELRNELLKNKVYGVLDTGMINVKWLFAHDAGLEEIVNGMKKTRLAKLMEAHNK